MHEQEREKCDMNSNTSTLPPRTGGPSTEKLPDNFRKLPGRGRGTIDEYIRYCRPQTGEILTAARLDVVYHRGEGDRLYYNDEDGRERSVWDFLGGYGSLIFGHNRPELVEVAMASLRDRVPFSAQASCRGGAARLGEKLGTMMQKRFGEEFVTTLANTGSEATESAIKHAEMQQRVRFQALEEKLRSDLTKIRPALKMGQIRINRESFARLNSSFRSIQRVNFEMIIETLIAHNSRAIWKAPDFLAVAGSFHGKTSGAVKLTHNPKYREIFERIGIQTHFVPAFEADKIRTAVERSMIKLYSLEVRKKEVFLVEREISNVAGLFVEPIQGEGGIHVAPPEFLIQCREVADEYQFPLIFDEIQTGMGRTGTWLYTEQSGCTGDYYLLSKSLGGGLAKVAALMICAKNYNPDFGYVHTSTFAEDDPGCFLATEALELLEADDGQLMRNCVRQGNAIMAGLRKIQARYPNVIKDIRGVGLLIGVEMEVLGDRGSPLTSSLSRQELLVPVVASYLLHEHGIRVAPALSAGQVIRLEPSAYISDEAIDECLRGFDRVCEVLYKQNMYELTKCLIGLEQPYESTPHEIQSYRRELKPRVSEEGLRKVAFIGHLIQADDVKLTDPTLGAYTEEQCERLMRRIFSVYGMVDFDLIEVRSITGERVLLGFLGLCFHSDIIIERMRNKDLGLLQEKIMECVDFAIQNNFTNIGFGGLSSIVMNNCKKVSRSNIGLTTGNSFTTAMGLDGMFHAAREADLDLSTATFAGIGANGNICSIYCKIMADHVPNLILVGREGREAALVDLADEIYYEALERIFLARNVDRIPLDELPGVMTGIARVVLHSAVVRKFFAAPNPDQEFDASLARAAVLALKDELGENAPILTTTDIQEIRAANLILGASSSSEAMITSEVLGEGPIVICDVALPQDTHESVLERDDVTVMLGGLVRLPLNPGFTVDGIPVPDGHAYACMSETLLLGLHGISENFSIGPISKTQVKKIGEIARIHGFQFGRNKREKSF